MQLMTNEQWEMTQWVKAIGGAGMVGLIFYFILSSFEGKK